jgi:hypothetical protein
MSTTKYEQILGELLRDGKVVYTAIRLDIKVTEMRVDEDTMPVARAIAEMALSPMSGLAVADGSYKLRYTFDGKQHKDSVRVQGGHLLSGVAA